MKYLVQKYANLEYTYSFSLQIWKIAEDSRKVLS